MNLLPAITTAELVLIIGAGAISPFLAAARHQVADARRRAGSLRSQLAAVQSFASRDAAPVDVFSVAASVRSALESAGLSITSMRFHTSGSSPSVTVSTTGSASRYCSALRGIANAGVTRLELTRSTSGPATESTTFAAGSSTAEPVAPRAPAVCADHRVGQGSTATPPSSGPTSGEAAGVSTSQETPSVRSVGRIRVHGGTDHTYYLDRATGKIRAKETEPETREAQP